MYSQLANDLNLQADLLNHAQKHKLIELEEVIERTVERVIHAYQTQAWHPPPYGNMQFTTALPTTRPAMFDPSVAPISASMGYLDMDIVLMPGLDGRELRWIVKQIVREIYEAVWDENE